MYKLTDLAGHPVFIVSLENVYMFHEPHGEYPDKANCVIIPVSGPTIAVKETVAQVAKIFDKGAT